MFRIYLITNQLNGKVYIGQTSRTVNQRWRNHISCAKRGEDHYLYRAVRKYGPTAFDVQEVAKLETKEQADSMERLWITVLRASDRNFGYNGSLGGDGHFVQNEETRQKKSLAMCEGFRNT